MNLCDPNEIGQLLLRHGFHFSKELGQNFLCDSSIPEKIAELADITPDTNVVEIGPGIGALTQELCKRAKKVAAVELDHRLPELLRETMSGADNFELIQGDVLKIDLKALCRERFDGGPVIACANLPYYITSPAISALLESGCFQRVVVMVQKEAAERICAAAGEKEYCAFSAQTAYFAKPQVILSVPRDRFIPQPRVDSVVMRLDVYETPPVPGGKQEVFRAIRAGFANRRKTLVNGICMEYGKKISKEDATSLLKSMGFSENIRGEALTLEQFGALAVKLHNYFAKIDEISAKN